MARAFVVCVAVSLATDVLDGRLARRGRLTSYHTRGAKLAAYLGGRGALVVFASGRAFSFRLATAALALAEIEEIAITLTLREWRADVPSLAYALALRRQPGLAGRTGGVVATRE
jgi:hypothetical protein